MSRGNHPGFFIFAFALLAFCLSGNKAAADWQWSNDSAAAPLNQGWYQATFTFTNSGSGTISVTDLSFSCSCTVYKFTSGKAKAGASGILEVKVQKDVARHADGQELDFYAFGQTSTTPKKLTMLLKEKPSQDK